MNAIFPFVFTLGLFLGFKSESNSIHFKNKYLSNDSISKDSAQKLLDWELKGQDSQFSSKIEFAISMGANINTKSKFGATALHLAAYNKAFDLAKILIQKGANINQKDGFGETPLYLAVSNQDYHISKLLIEHGADVNTMQDDGFSPLTESQDVEIDKLLLAHGADINQKAKNGLTPFEAICRSQNATTELLDFLKLSGADLKSRSKWGYTPLHSAALWGTANTIAYLIQNGCNIDSKDSDGNTPIYLSVKYTNVGTTKWLLDHKADLNIKNNKGLTPIIEAINTPILEIFQLVAKNIGINYTDSLGRTLLYITASLGDYSKVDYLLDEGAYTDWKANDGKTAFDVASSDEIKALIKKYERY